jgi:uncharacterized cupredoxin-like copper-binding protein
MRRTAVAGAPSGRPWRRISAVALVGAVLVLTAACSHHPRPPRPTVTTTVPGPVNEVTFVLSNGKIAQQGDVKPGRNTVHVTNEGTIEHEIIFTKAAGGATLPTKANGSWDESAMPRGSIIGEVELEAGQSATKTFTFTPGDWVAVCNIVSGTTSHFKNGMWMDFSVS